VNLSLTQLRYFLAVAECLSYTEAARRLNVSQPPLSKQVALLEAELGLMLFRREHRGVTLTEAGAAFAEGVKGLFGDLDRSVARAQLLAGGGEGRIRLVLPQAMVLDRIQGWIRSFLDAHPGIQFQVERLDMREGREALLKGEVDLLLTLGFEEGSLPGCTCRELDRRKGCWILSKEHPLAGGALLEATQLEGLDLVIQSREMSPGGYAMAMQTCRAAGFTPRRIQEVSSFDAALTYVELGYGVMVVGRPLADQNADRFKAFDLPEGCDYVGLILCWRPETKNPCLPPFLEGLGPGAWRGSPGLRRECFHVPEP